MGRQTMLQTSGHSKREIQKQIKEANIHRSKRRHTVSMLHQKQLHEMVEKTKRSIRNFMTKKKVREIRFIESSMDIAKRKQAEADILAENEAFSYEGAANEIGDSSIFALNLEGNEVNDSDIKESFHALGEKAILITEDEDS